MKQHEYSGEQIQSAERLRERILKRRRGTLRLDKKGERLPYTTRRRPATEAIAARLDFLPPERLPVEIKTKAAYKAVMTALEAIPPAIAGLINLEAVPLPKEKDKKSLFLDLRTADVVADSFSQAGITFDTDTKYLIYDNTKGMLARTMLLAFPQCQWHVCLAGNEQLAWAKTTFPKLTFLSEEEAHPSKLAAGFDGIIGLSLLTWPEDAASEALEGLQKAIKPGGTLLVSANGYGEILTRLERKSSLVGALKRCFSALEQSGFFFEQKKKIGTKPSKVEAFVTADWVRRKTEQMWTVAFARFRALNGRHDIYVLRRK